MLSKTLLDVLACPKCKKEVMYDRKSNKLICAKCKLRYKILKGDIPDMLLDNAEKF